MISEKIKGSSSSTGMETNPQTGPSQADEQKKVDDLLASNGNLNSNAITDQIFYDRYPELKGTKLTKDNPLTSEWKQIKSSVVEPRMTELKTQAGSTPVKEQPGNGSSSVAADAKGIKDMEAGLIQKSLWGKIESANNAPADKMEDPKFAELNKNAQSLPSGSEVASNTPAKSAQELAKVDTTKMTETEKYDHFKDLIETGGGTFNTEPGARNIVSIRTPDSVDAGVKNDNGEGQGVYNDKMAVVWKDENGTCHVKEFTGNTEPNRRWANDEHGSQDVNSDGKNDAGRLLPGFYEFKVGTRNKGTEDALLPTSDVKVERDINGDGLYNDDFTGSAGTSILFHNGKGNNSTGSAGCQTLKKDEWPAFWEAVSQGSNKENIGYTLIQQD